MRVRHDENITYAEHYLIDIPEYADAPVTTLPFSIRIINRFMGNGITTVAKLLEATPAQLMQLKGFGRTCLVEVEKYCETLAQNGSAPSLPAPKKQEGKNKFKQFNDQIALGDFSFVEQMELIDDERAYIAELREAYDILGAEFVLECITEPEKIVPIFEMINTFQDEIRPYLEIQNLTRNIPTARMSKRAMWYIKAFTIKEEEREVLNELCSSENATIAEMVAHFECKSDSLFILTKQFLKWCTFDLHEEIDQLFNKLYTNERTRTVIQARAAGQTLEQAGNLLGVTRERIRQIEMKVKRTFSRLHSRVRIVSKIAAERDGDTILTPTEIARYCNNDSDELLYLLQSYDGTNYTYDRQLGVFVLGDDSLHNRVNAYLETLPNVVNDEQFEKYAAAAEDEEDIPKEMFEKAFLESYRRTGAVYHRSRLSLAVIYQDIISKYYPDGMHVYDSVELNQFRKYVVNEYGDVQIPENDRALSGRIASVCILCGRGRYRLKKDQYMPKKLADKIYAYIKSGNSPVYLTGSIFRIFEDELIAAGIDNRYYLQGVMHEIFADKLTFRRDYISTDASVTSLYSAIVDFIKKSKYPVSKAQIQTAFPGITDIVITLSVNDPEILNYFGEYLHASRIFISDVERKYLRSVIEKILSDGSAHHAKDFYEIINSEKPEVFKRNAAMYPFSAYSILEYLFRNDFQFLRPYIANNGVEIGRPGERLHELIYSSESFAIADIREFAKENRFQIQSMIEYANMCNDEYLLIDRDTLMRIDNIGITAEDAEEIDRIIAQNIVKTIPIVQLDIWGSLPSLNVPWTEWLLYSVLNKWGNRVMVGTSSNQMKMAVPLVAPTGKYDASEFANMTASSSASAIRIDDLDNLDELLEDIIGDEFWEEPDEF